MFVFYLNLYVLLRCAAIPPWASLVGASVGLLAWNTQVYAKLDYNYSQLCMVAVSARRRSVVTPISWQSSWNTRLLVCSGSARSREPRRNQ